jgi:hypothetical protein
MAEREKNKRENNFFLLISGVAYADKNEKYIFSL